MSVTVSLRDEVTELLQDLIRVDTTNPPGNETAAAEVLREYLEESGAQVDLYARVPERANLVARIPGRGEGPTLLFLSHTDVVLADATEWSADPFGGELRDGEVWGRGALDMKGQVAASAVALASLAREGFEPAGDLIFAATADEEVGDGFGAQWLCETHPDAVRCDYLINEGSGERLELGGKPFYTCSVAEKMSAPFRLRVRGRSGHASMPGIADNALVKAAPLITALGEYVPEQQLTPEVEALLEAVTGKRPASPQDALEQARAIGEFFAEMVEPLLSLTLSPTMIGASKKRNVIPARLRRHRRLAAAAGDHDRRAARDRAQSARRRRLRARSRSRRTAARARRSTRRSGTRSPAGSRRSSRTRSRHRSAWRGSPTATGSARLSGRLRTASSRCA